MLIFSYQGLHPKRFTAEFCSDDVVQPELTKDPTSVLPGAANIALQGEHTHSFEGESFFGVSVQHFRPLILRPEYM